MKKVIFILLFSLLIFSTLYVNTTSAANGLITVKLVNYLGNKSQISIDLVGKHSVIDDNRNVTEGTSYVVKNENNSINLYQGNTLVKKYGSALTIEPYIYGPDSYVSVNGKPYLGTMKFSIEGSYVRPSNTVTLTDYLKGVVPNEMYQYWPIEALKAQAVAARTYATNYLDSTNIDDSQSYQVYGGFKYYPNTSKAVEETRGEVIAYNGKSIKSSAVYSSSNGGMKLSNVNSWGSTAAGATNYQIPYLKNGIDPYDLLSSSATPNNTRVNWSFELTEKQIDLEKLDKTRPHLWWSQVSEVNDSNIINNIKSWMVKQKLINSNYEMKITKVDNVNFTTAFNQTDVLKGSISIKYILKDKTNNTYRTSDGSIEEFSYTLNQRSYTIRSIIGSTTMFSPYISEVKSEVENDDSKFVVNGGGYGHGIGMSQFGAYVMAGGKLDNVINPHSFKYKDILSFYYSGTTTMLEQSLLQVPVKLVSVSTDKVSPQVPDSAITINAAGSGGNEKLYKFNVYDGKEWKVVQDYSAANSYLWKPSNIGNYTFSIHIKDKYSINKYDDHKTFDYQIANELVNIVSVTTDKLSPQSSNSQINLSVNTDGGNEPLYKFNIFDGKNWTVLRDYGTSSSFNWIPTSPGDYTFSIHVKGSNSLEAYDDYYVLDYSVIGAPVIKNIAVDKKSPQYTNETIKLTVDAVGGINKQYKFNVYDGKEWKVLQDYASTPALNWTPTEVGDYKFSVHVKDANSTKAYDHYQVLNYQINSNEVKVHDLSSNVSSPQLEGTTINLTATATGGLDKLYKFHVYNGKEWIVLRDYGTSNQIDWKPSAGEYKLVVHVKDRASSKAYDSYTSKTFKINNDPVIAKSLDLNLVSPQPDGTAMKVTATATGGVDKLYKFHLFNGKEWTVLRDYGTSNQIDWKPSAGEYKLVVHVKDRASSKAYDSYTSKNFTVNKTSVRMESITKAYESPQAAGTAVKLTANATGGSNKLYKFHVYNGTEWKVLRDYNASNTHTWIPTKAGQYKISIHVKDQSSTKSYDAYQAFEYQVVAPVKMTNVTKVDQDTENVRITANATGGIDKQYKFWVLNPQSNEWQVLQDYAANNVYDWKPGVTGEYKVSVHVKDKNSSNSYDDFEAFTYQK